MILITLYLLTLPVVIIIKRQVKSELWNKIVSLIAMVPVVAGAGFILESVFESIELRNEKVIQYFAFGVMIYAYRY